MGDRGRQSSGAADCPHATNHNEGRSHTADGDGSGRFRRRNVRPLLERYCIDCHDEESAEAGINLDRFEDQEAAFKEGGRTWLRVRDALQGGIMPPADEDQPSLEERERIVAWIENDYLPAQCGQGARSAPVVIRRLNRQEYNNTIRDLLGLDLHLADAFPPDDIGFGFDNVGSALNISPAHVEKYLDAAELALQKAIVPPDAEGYPPAELIGLKTYPLPPDKPVEFKHALKPGRYLADFSLVRVGIAESVPPPRLVIGFGKDRRTLDAVRVQDETVVYRYWLTVAKGDDTGPRRAGPRPGAEPERRQAHGGRRQRQRRPALWRPSAACTSIRWSSADPSRSTSSDLPESHRRILFCTPGIRRPVAARLRPPGDRAVRRTGLPPARRSRRKWNGSSRSSAWLMTGARATSAAVQIALTTVLASPRFLFLVEPEPTREDRPLDRVRAGQPALVFPLEQHARR